MELMKRKKTPFWGVLLMTCLMVTTVRGTWLEFVLSELGFPREQVHLPMDSIESTADKGTLKGGTFDAELTDGAYYSGPGLRGKFYGQAPSPGAYPKYLNQTNEPCFMNVSSEVCPDGFTAAFLIMFLERDVNELKVYYGSGLDGEYQQAVVILGKGGIIIIELLTENGPLTIDLEFSPTYGDWNHIVVAYTGIQTGIATVYVNGDLVHSSFEYGHDGGLGRNSSHSGVEFGKPCSSDSDCPLKNTACMGTPGYCACAPGYDYNSRLGICELEVHDCAEGTHSCSHTCEDRYGSFVCLCPEGYILEYDGKTCQDLDECLSDSTNNCSSLGDAICENLIGSYQCTCVPGYNSSGTACLDIDECLSANGGCDHTCNNTIGSFECHCDEGYTLEYNKRGCADLNECNDPKTCTQTSANHLCHNTDGSYTCGCTMGYFWKNGSCGNTNECSVKNGGCQHVCEDSDGSFNCTCHTGYVLNADEKTCRDYDECAENNGGCEHRCLNSPGSRYCTCVAGYVLANDTTSCYVADGDGGGGGCGLLNGGCEHICSGNSGSVNCSCLEGYVLNADQKTCRDYDECAENNGGCEHRCLNSPGSRYCTCKSGYVLAEDGTSCNLADSDGGGGGCGLLNGGCEHICSENSGSVNCSCLDGYVLNADQKTCRDHDECAENNGECQHRCLNSPGSRYCTCRAGYVLAEDGTSCNLADQGMGGCAHICSENSGSVNCSCLEGYVLNAGQKTCRDGAGGGGGEVGCSLLNGGCQHICSENSGSVNCSCLEGYVINADQKSCRDYDECADSNGGCEHRCLNSPGSRYCSCRAGYLLDADGASCYLDGSFGVPVKIRFDGLFKIWMADFFDSKSEKLTRSMEQKIHGLLRKMLRNNNALVYQRFYVSGFERGSVLASADLTFDEELTDFEVSYVVWQLSDLLDGVTVTTDDVTLTVPDTVTDRVQSVRNETSSVSVNNSCSVVDYENICGEGKKCKERENDTPYCVCAEDTCTGVDPGSDVTDASPGNGGGGVDDDNDGDGLSGELVLMIVMLCTILPILLGTIVGLIIFNKRRSRPVNAHNFPLPVQGHHQNKPLWRMPPQSQAGGALRYANGFYGGSR